MVLSPSICDIVIWALHDKCQVFLPYAVNTQPCPMGVFSGSFPKICLHLPKIFKARVFQSLQSPSATRNLFVLFPEKEKCTTHYPICHPHIEPLCDRVHMPSHNWSRCQWGQVHLTTIRWHGIVHWTCMGGRGELVCALHLSFLGFTNMTPHFWPRITLMVFAHELVQTNIPISSSFQLEPSKSISKYEVEGWILLVPWL